MKIISYNVNGLRSALSKGLMDWLKAVEPDIICLQEIKVDRTKWNELCALFEGYHASVSFAAKKGYSGVAVFSRPQPMGIKPYCGVDNYDNEGRYLQVDFQEFSLVNLYLPSGTMGTERQAFKEQFMDFFLPYIRQVRTEKQRVVLVGDFNICHTELDIHNPSKHTKMSGFLPNERAWLSDFIADGWIDTYRYLNPTQIAYTWWSYRAGSKAKDLGWRIDYQFVSESLATFIHNHRIYREIDFSDHCPIELEITNLT